jgi:hypothetical protein
MRVAAAEFVAEFISKFVAEFLAEFVVRPRSHALPIPTPPPSIPLPPTAALFADNPKDS